MAQGSIPGADGAYLAHIADTVTATEEKLDRLLDGQRQVIAILTRFSEALSAQSEMLAEILGAAVTDPGPSPVAEVLAALVAAVNDNTATLDVMTGDLKRLPVELGAVLAQALGDAPPAESG